MPIIAAQSSSCKLRCMHAQVMPIISMLALFGVIALVACCCITLGPVAHVEANSLTYSAVRPPR